MKPLDIYITLLGQFALLSILAIGGANAVVPEIHRLSVHDQHWMTDTQFVDLFALAQAAPGPNVLVVSLIGLQVGGLLGALITTLAMCGPSSVLAYTISNAWDRFRDRPWRKATQARLAPVTIGLVLGSGLDPDRRGGPFLGRLRDHRGHRRPHAVHQDPSAVDPGRGRRAGPRRTRLAARFD